MYGTRETRPDIQYHTFINELMAPIFFRMLHKLKDYVIFLWYSAADFKLPTIKTILNLFKI